MRRTCARVLAAALMAVAVAAAMALPGRYLGGTNSEPHRAFTAPTASSKRVIHVDVRVTSTNHGTKAHGPRLELARRSSALASTVAPRQPGLVVRTAAPQQSLSARHGSIRPRAPQNPRP